MRCSKWNRVPLAAILAWTAGCGVAAEESDGATWTTAPREAPVSWEAFSANAYKEPWPDGVYLVDGEVPLAGEEGLRAYYDSWFDQTSALTVNQVYGADDVYDASKRFSLTYCISSGFGDRLGQVETAMAAAAASWQDWIGVRFTYVKGEAASCDQNDAKVFFDVRSVADDGVYASSFFPSDARASRSVRVRPAAFTTNSGGRDLEGILRHELGHALGFRHEHIWLGASCTDETTDGARQVTAYDVDSVMHYPQCRPSGSGGFRQSDADYRGSVSLYGLSALLVDSATAPITLL